MRFVSDKERRQRGCEYCLHHKGKKCKYRECPYHELDNVESYEDYMDNIGFFFDSLLIEGILL